MQAGRGLASSTTPIQITKAWVYPNVGGALFFDNPIVV
jgi:hypothetical protein